MNQAACGGRGTTSWTVEHGALFGLHIVEAY
jgi:hypothetical protein